jgi:hypothetical protein
MFGRHQITGIGYRPARCRLKNIARPVQVFVEVRVASAIRCQTVGFLI